MAAAFVLASIRVIECTVKGEGTKNNSCNLRKPILPCIREERIFFCGLVFVLSLRIYVESCVYPEVLTLWSQQTVCIASLVREDVVDIHRTTFRTREFEGTM